MRLEQFKHKVCVAVTAFALGVTVLAGTDADAATIKTEPQTTSKQTVEVGDTFSKSGITNLKINGKKYSKYKKKIKTVQTSYDPTYIKNKSNVTKYVDSEFVADSEDYNQQKDENYKYISAGSYQFTFLKTGTYKISYDVYETGDSKITPNPDGVSSTTTYELIKTHHVDTYKVVTTTNPIKSFTLGKNKITNTYKSSGTKYNCKTVTKYRYLKGKSGKLTIKTNSNYKITSAFVVTYNENGEVIVTPSGNGKTVTYGTGKQTSKIEKEQYVLDENGNCTYVKDAAGQDTDERVSQMITTATSTSKYKPTTIYYGYKDSFTGSYTNYAVGTKTIYVPKRDEKKHLVYEKNADGTYVYDENGYRKKVIDTVTATVITRTYPQHTKVDGAYATVPVVQELVVFPGAKNIYEDGEYYLDANCKGDSFDAGEFETVSKAGVNVYDYVTLTDGRVKRYENPVYNRKFYSVKYQGSWQPVAEGEYGDTDYADRTIDPTTGDKTYTTRYKWVETKDAEGESIAIKDYNYVQTSSLDSSKTFNAK